MRKLLLLPLLITVLFAGPRPASANPENPIVTVNVGGVDYDVTYVMTSFNADSALVMAQPWWEPGRVDRAQAFAAAVSGSLGFPFAGATGPVFAFDAPPNIDAVLTMGFGRFSQLVVPSIVPGRDWVVPYAAISAGAAVPEPSIMALGALGGLVLLLRRRK